MKSCLLDAGPLVALFDPQDRFHAHFQQLMLEPQVPLQLHTTWPCITEACHLLGPRYRGLLRDIFRRKVLAPDVSLYLHRPTATDPAMAPSGCDAFYVLAPVPNLQGEIDWRDVLRANRDEVLAQALVRRLRRV